eukprot:4834027-Pleurochrysis_carterae.AAC.2
MDLNELNILFHHRTLPTGGYRQSEDIKSFSSDVRLQSAATRCGCAGAQYSYGVRQQTLANLGNR